MEAAEAEGVNFHFLVAPKEVLVHRGTVQGVRCVQMELGPPDESGRRRPLPVHGSEFTQNADTVFTAIGQLTNAGVVDGTSGFVFGPKQSFRVNPETFETDVAGVFVSGDATTGADIAIRACATGKAAAEAIHAYLKEKQQNAPV
jgi:NADPH-dependent glutamate synthase beta subunit-like oxidoreductase